MCIYVRYARYSNTDEGGNSCEEGAVGYDTSLQQQPSTSLSRQANDGVYEPICVDRNASTAEEEEDDENIYETIEEIRQQQHLQQQHALNHPTLAPPMEEPIYFDHLSCSSTYGRIGETNKYLIS